MSDTASTHILSPFFAPSLLSLMSFAVGHVSFYVLVPMREWFVLLVVGDEREKEKKWKRASERKNEED